MAKADPRKRQEWLERLARFETSDQTVAEFCATEGVSVPSFYQWRRKLRTSAKDVPSKKFQRLRVQDGVGIIGAGIIARLPNGIVFELNSTAADSCLDRLFDADGESPC